MREPMRKRTGPYFMYAKDNAIIHVREDKTTSSNCHFLYPF